MKDEINFTSLFSSNNNILANIELYISTSHQLKLPLGGAVKPESNIQQVSQIYQFSIQVTAQTILIQDYFHIWFRA